MIIMTVLILVIVMIIVRVLVFMFLVVIAIMLDVIMICMVIMLFVFPMIVMTVRVMAVISVQFSLGRRHLTARGFRQNEQISSRQKLRHAFFNGHFVRIALSSVLKTHNIKSRNFQLHRKRCPVNCDVQCTVTMGMRSQLTFFFRQKGMCRSGQGGT
jgi:hypothetical protein